MTLYIYIYLYIHIYLFMPKQDLDRFVELRNILRFESAGKVNTIINCRSNSQNAPVCGTESQFTNILYPHAWTLYI